MRTLLLFGIGALLGVIAAAITLDDSRELEPEPDLPLADAYVNELSHLMADLAKRGYRLEWNTDPLLARASNSYTGIN